MECRDAQFDLRFRRPGSDELGPEAAAELDRHLAGCPQCGPAARADAAFDRAVAVAMAAVPVPAGLRNRLVAHVAAQRGAVLRRKAYRYAGLAAAACLVVGIGLGGLVGRRVEPNVYALLDQADQSHPEEKAVNSWLARNGLPPQLPADFDYSLFVDHAIERVQGRDVPVVVFRGRDGSGFAKVYIFRDAAGFEADKLREQVGKNHPSSQSAATIATLGDQRGVVYVIVHTGPTLDPFLKRFPPPI